MPRAALLLSPTALGIPQELVPRIEHEQIGLVLKYVRIRIHAAIELEELGILAKRLCIDRRGSCIAVAAGLLRGSIGFRRDHDRLPIGIGADRERAFTTGW